MIIVKKSKLVGFLLAPVYLGTLVGVNLVAQPGNVAAKENNSNSGYVKTATKSGSTVEDSNTGTKNIKIISKKQIKNQTKSTVTSQKSRIQSASEIGLVADGKTDNTPKLNAWLNQAPNYKVSTLNFGKGNYVFNGTVLMKSNVNFKGIKGQTTFSNNGNNGTVFHYPSSATGYDGGVQNVNWEGITFEGHQESTEKPAVINYSKGSVLTLNTKALNKTSEQIGKAVDNVKINKNKQYDASFTYQTSDHKSKSVVVQVATASGKWQRQRFNVIADGKPHTISMNATLTGNTTSFYLGTDQEFNGTMSNPSLIEKGTSKNILNQKMDSSGWRLWVPSNKFLAQNEQKQNIIPTLSTAGTFTQSILHGKNINFKNNKFVNAQNQGGHLFDLDGSSYINIDNSEISGFGNQIGIYDMNKESIQVDYANSGAMSWHQKGDVYDGIASHHITVKNNKFLPIKNSTGKIISYAPNPIGEHVMQSNGQPANFYHDVVFENNYVLDALPAKAPYLSALSDGVTKATGQNWDYAGHAVLHFPGTDNLTIKDNIFESDPASKIKTAGYIRLMNWDSKYLKHKNISITNNVFKNIQSDKPLIDFGDDGSRNDLPGTVWDKVTIKNNSFINEPSKSIRLVGTDKGSGKENKSIKVNGDISKNSNQKLIDKTVSINGQKEEFNHEGYTPYKVGVKLVNHNGKELSHKDITGYYGESYSYSLPKFDGYTAKETKISGVFGLSSQSITVKYQGQKIKKTVNLQDQYGYKLGSKTFSGYYGDVVKTPQKSGYSPITKSFELNKQTPKTIKYKMDTMRVVGKQALTVYKKPDLVSKNKIDSFSHKNVLYAPSFVVYGKAYSSAGRVRYVIGKNRYISPNSVNKQYYDSGKTVYVINPNGIYSHKDSKFSSKIKAVHHYTQGTKITVKRTISLGSGLTRFQLSNGTYITSNRQFVSTSNPKLPKKVKAKTNVNRYSNPNLSGKKTYHYKKGSSIKVIGFDYSNKTNSKRGDTLRYKISGGYITGNGKYVK